MSGLPEVTIAGTLTADPEITYLDSGACVVNFTVAANDRRFNKDTGGWEDASATFLRCSAWRALAEHIGESLKKGQRVLATGALKQRSWETDTGEKRSAFELAVTEIGPSLKFATASVAKKPRNGGQSVGSSSAEDLWPQAPAAQAASGETPPF